MNRRLFFTLIFFAFGAFLFGEVSIAADDSSYGLIAVADAADLKKYGTDVPVLIGNVVGTALSLVSIVFFILAVYGGFRMMLARGKEDEFTKGKDILIHASIGLVIVLASYAITSFMFSSLGPGEGGNTTPSVVELACTSPTSQYKNTVTDGTGLSIHEEASTTAKELANMPDGAAFEKCSNASSGSWSVVTFGGIVGWADVATHAEATGAADPLPVAEQWCAEGGTGGDVCYKVGTGDMSAVADCKDPSKVFASESLCVASLSGGEAPVPEKYVIVKHSSVDLNLYANENMTSKKVSKVENKDPACAVWVADVEEGYKVTYKGTSYYAKGAFSKISSSCP